MDRLIRKEDIQCCEMNSRELQMAVDGICPHCLDNNMNHIENGRFYIKQCVTCKHVFVTGEKDGA